eukprot:TRINITY_DN715_c0_g1_i1.p1 TRINITY_DN715_c0_g1~~TRINITY_DN715_c0_g1_i1.p1  ORF type:complete len:177 (+),score=2.73 TRINITY_DN715_c0_g1_i1:282-812(+)
MVLHEDYKLNPRLTVVLQRLHDCCLQEHGSIQKLSTRCTNYIVNVKWHEDRRDDHEFASLLLLQLPPSLKQWKMNAQTLQDKELTHTGHLHRLKATMWLFKISNDATTSSSSEVAYDLLPRPLQQPHPRRQNFTSGKFSCSRQHITYSFYFTKGYYSSNCPENGIKDVEVVALTRL